MLDLWTAGEGNRETPQLGVSFRETPNRETIIDEEKSWHLIKREKCVRVKKFKMKCTNESDDRRVLEEKS